MSTAGRSAVGRNERQQVVRATFPEYGRELGFRRARVHHGAAAGEVGQHRQVILPFPDAGYLPAERAVARVLGAYRIECVDREVGQRGGLDHLLSRVLQLRRAHAWPDQRHLGSTKDSARTLLSRLRTLEAFVAPEVRADEEQRLAPAPDVPYGIGDARDRFRHAYPAQAIAAFIPFGIVDHHLVLVAWVVGGPDGWVVEGYRPRPIDHGQEPGAIRREVLRRAAVREGAREDHGGQIVRPQRVDRRGGDAPGQLLILEPDRPVEHDDDQPAFGPHVVGRHVRRHVAHPRRASARSTGTNAAIGRGLPSSKMVKSAFVRPRTGRRSLSRTDTSTCTTSTPDWNVA